MYLFSIVATTIYHKPHGLKQHNIVILQFWSLNIKNEAYQANIKVTTGQVLSLVYGEESVVFAFSSF